MQIIIANRSKNASIYVSVDKIRSIYVYHEAGEFGVKIWLSDGHFLIMSVGSENMAKELVNELPLYISGLLLDGAACIYIDIEKFVETRKHKLLDRESLKCSCGSELKVDLRHNSNILPEKFILDCKECACKYCIPTENMLAWCKDDS